MPARTVVFSQVLQAAPSSITTFDYFSLQIQKHDGQSFRELLPGEYTQVSILYLHPK